MEATDTKTTEQMEEEKKKEQARIEHEKECEARPYSLYVGSVYRHAVYPYEKDNYVEECNSMSGFEVYTKDVEAIKSACAQLGLKFFKIEHDHNTIFESDAIIAQNNRHQAEADAAAAEMQSRADAFNALPDVIQQWNLPEGAIVQLKKSSAAEYKRGWSNSKMYQGSTTIELSIPGTVKATTLYPDGWITRDGKIQKKKLREAFVSWPAAVVEALINSGLTAYSKAKDDIRSKYRV